MIIRIDTSDNIHRRVGSSFALMHHVTQQQHTKNLKNLKNSFSCSSTTYSGDMSEACSVPSSLIGPWSSSSLSSRGAGGTGFLWETGPEAEPGLADEGVSDPPKSLRCFAKSSRSWGWPVEYTKHIKLSDALLSFKDVLIDQHQKSNNIISIEFGMEEPVKNGSDLPIL
mgnify:CR=1 FL=1